MTISAGSHQIGDVGVSGRRVGHPWAPTVMHTENTFGGPSLLDHPEPSRCRLMMWLPEWAEDAYMPRAGATMICDADVNGTTVTYFTGQVDEIRAGRRRGETTPAVTWLNAPTVTAKDTVTGASAVVTTRRVGRATVIEVGGDSEGARRTLKLVWTAPMSAVWSSTVLVHGAPSNVYPLDLNAAVKAFAYLPEPSVSIVGTTTPVEKNRTVYPVRSDYALTPSVTAYVYVMPGDGTRTFTVPDPALVNVAGPSTVRGRYVQVDASDYLAPAGRLRIGDRPFPRQTPSVRWNAISGLVAAAGLPIIESSDSSPSGNLDGGASMYGGDFSYLVRPLDIDRRSALDVLQRTTMAAVGALTISTKYGVDYQRRPTPYRTIIAPATGPVTLGDNPAISTMPSSVVEEVPRLISASSVVNQVEFDVAVLDANGNTVVTESVGIVADDDSIMRSGPASVRLSSDAARFPQHTKHAVQARAGNLIRTEPVWTFDGDARIVDVSGVSNAARLIDPATRHGHAVRLTGTLPADVTPEWRVRGGSFTVGRDDPFMLTLDPAAWLVDVGVSWQDLGNLRTSPAITFSDTSPITFAQMAEAEV